MGKTGKLSETLRFNGQWRSYQKRVLDKADNYLKDKRIHIVAAPGSGKTTLGIELIRRQDEPCLILAPSINIRDQWIARIKEAFLTEEGNSQELLSSGIRNPAVITAITYQALHACMTRRPGNETTPVRRPDKTEETGFSRENNGESGSDSVWEAETVKVETAEADGQGEEAGAAESVEEDRITDDAEAEKEDYTNFDLFRVLKNAGVRTICLDEAHHLRSEWWKALEELVKKMPELTVISLTATPPYDSTPAQWQRYISLCGPIDEEIIVPELVKEGSLCPHQDYIYFNMPTGEEEEAVVRFREAAFAAADKLYRDDVFAGIISSHMGLADPSAYTEKFLANPQYLSALLIFLDSRNIQFSRELLALLGTGTKLPVMTMKWMELLLQGFLYEDTESYVCEKSYREQLIDSLKLQGMIRKNKVCIMDNEEVSKMLVSSKGKISSILEITKAEYENLGEELRLLILTDYIKKEYTQAVGDQERDVNALGVIPIFENIRRTFSGVKTDKNTTRTGARITSSDLRIGVLSGTVVYIPLSAEGTLQEILKERGIKADIKECGAEGYCQITVKGTEHTASSVVTEIFNKGEIRVLIGTKSLLGEGWDSPCINTLILASFVGSFMLSNQMRGRAIRTMKGNPDKVSNIWHLICMEPERKRLKEAVNLTYSGRFPLGESPSGKGTGINAGKEEEIREPEESQDFVSLKRRFEGFLGLHYTENVIENGLERLSLIAPPYHQAFLDKINAGMLQLAADRQKLRERWNETLAALGKMEIAVETGVAKSGLNMNAVRIKSALRAVLWGILSFLPVRYLIAPMAAGGNGVGVLLACAISAPFIVLTLKHLLAAIRLGNASKYLKAVGSGVLDALRQAGDITSREAKTETEDKGGSECFIYLKGGSEREKDVFAKCIYELFGKADQQRYLLRARGNVPRLCRYYFVPEQFGRKKEEAELLHGRISRYLGRYDLFYTRNEAGKMALLEAELHSLANKKEGCVSMKKRVKSGN